MRNLFDICKVELDESRDTQYIGITIEEGNPKVIFPRGYDLSLDKNELRKDLILLIKVLDKYRNRKKNRIYSEELEDLLQGNGDKFSFTNTLWLIRDYENNGLYNEYIHNYKIDKKGNVNWARTIKTQIPYSSNKRLVYLDFVVKEKRNDLNNIILLIQKYVIERCIDNVGWLYPNINIEKGNKLPYNLGTCINILSKELQLSNIDTTKQLIKHMIDFLKHIGEDKSKQRLEEYKTKYFMNIWEDMLNVVLGNQDASNYYPNANWNILGKTTKASNLKPDVIMKVKNKIYVIDAKYYKYGITNKISDLPQSTDITKQLLYSSYIKSNYGIDAYDAFILPYKNINNEDFKFVGNANVDIDEFNNKKVVCILADIKKIMQLYIYMNNLEDYRAKIKLIIDNEN